MVWTKCLVFLVVLSSRASSNSVACPNITTIPNPDLVPQDKFVELLTNPCHYDRFSRPKTTSPLQVLVDVDVHHLEAAQSEFKVYMSVQYIYTDSMLNYENTSRKAVILGDESLKDKIWTPKVFVTDENDSTIEEIQQQDVFITVTPAGKVTFANKMVATFYCWMDLKKFPFDSQSCTIVLSDWSYNKNNLVMSWNKAAVKANKNLHFTEFILDEIVYGEGANKGPYSIQGFSSLGNFSALSITFKFHREVGFYLLDFFAPSYLLVFTAWVTFWLQADAGPPRATLGASTVVAFITLHLGVGKDLPKVSYIKASDVWFMGISCFIFSSLAEFAFVNVIWRRRKTVELKKPNNKYILKSAVMPRAARRDLRKVKSMQALWTTSSSASLDSALSQINFPNENFRNKDSKQSNADSGQVTLSLSPSSENLPRQQINWSTMTPQEVAIWIDRKARLVFPLIFLVFNIMYWTFVYAL